MNVLVTYVSDIIKLAKFNVDIDLINEFVEIIPAECNFQIIGLEIILVQTSCKNTFSIDHLINENNLSDKMAMVLSYDQMNLFFKLKNNILLTINKFDINQHQIKYDLAEKIIILIGNNPNIKIENYKIKYNNTYLDYDSAIELIDFFCTELSIKYLIV